MRRTGLLTIITTASIAALVTLAGCSSQPADSTSPGGAQQQGGKSNSSFTYTFIPDPTALNPSGLADPYEEIIVEVPESLVEASAPLGAGLLFTSVKISAREVAGVTYCAADIAPSFTDGAVERLSEPEVTEEAALANAEVQAQNEIDNLLYLYRVSTAEELAQYLEGEYGPAAANPEGYFMFLEAAAAQGSETADKLLQTEASTGQPAGTYQQAIDSILEGFKSDADAVAKQQADDAAAVPVAERISRNLGMGEVRPISELDPDSPTEGAYVSDDHAAFTVVSKCAASPGDSGTDKIAFPAYADGKIKRLAEVEFLMMQNGTVALTESEVNGFVLDSNNYWIAD